MSTVIAASLAILGAAGVLCMLRLLRRGSSLADRIVALDTLLVVIVTGVGVAALTERGEAFLDLLVVTALLGFVATVTVARFIERRGT